MITTLSLRNFKCLQEVQIDLEPFTIFVGPNASGKSSILEALDFLCRASRCHEPGSFDADLLRRRSRGTSDSIELAAECNGRAYRYRTPSPAAMPTRPRTGPKKWTGAGLGLSPGLAANGWKEWKPELVGSDPLPISVLVRLESSKLILSRPAAPDATLMDPDGTGIHTALANMALNEPDTWQTLQANLHRIIPSIRRLRFTRAPNIQEPTALLFDTVGADSLSANEVSEGALLVLGLLAAIHLATRPRLVLIDDLDGALHPKAQEELITLLRGLLETNPDLQIIANTHSPYMLDHMEPAEVRMTALNEEGATMCAPLASHPDFRKWKEELAPGEMWSVFGEKWVLGAEVG